MKKRISCAKKVKHKNEEAAWAACRELKRRGFIARVYKCRRCNMWHVGKPSYFDNHEAFWRNIYRQMTQHDRDVLRVSD
jgi:hypothetical protein